MSCLYWLYIGWWLEPIKYFVKCIFMLMALIPSSKNNNYKLDDDEFYSKSDIEDIKRDLRSDIEDEICFELEGKIRAEIEKEYYGDNTIKKKTQQIAATKEDVKMYDSNKGIYPPGQYEVGVDIEMGKYLLTSIDDCGGIVTLYENYQSYLKDKEIKEIDFDGEYHLALKQNGMFIVIEYADVKKI